MEKKPIKEAIESAVQKLPRTYPLYAYVTSNPLIGLEHLHFDNAVEKGQEYFRGMGYPSPYIFRDAFKNGEINKDHLKEQLIEGEVEPPVPEESLRFMEKENKKRTQNHALSEVDRIMVKWLSVFMDQGSAEWPMPNREKGFYRAWRSTAQYDKEIPKHRTIKGLPKDPLTYLQHILPEHISLKEVFTHHLMALPGWCGAIKYRSESDPEWQKACPIELKDYLAVRIALCQLLGKPIDNTYSFGQVQKAYDRHAKCWLKAWEKTFQEELVKQLKVPQREKQYTQQKPKAQLVFCIDTRSEKYIKNLEEMGPYETFGFAGFFGVPMDQDPIQEKGIRKSCPPILPSNYVYEEQPRKEKEKTVRKHFNNISLKRGFKSLLGTLKNNIPASFGYVEFAGVFYGVNMWGRTFIPKTWERFLHRFIKKPAEEPFHAFIPTLKRVSDKGSDDQKGLELTVKEKAKIASATFTLTGWKELSSLVLFVGHGSQTQNNPFASSLDCGACSGNNGRYNARILASICNEHEVRKELKTGHGIEIPDSTVFLAAEHNTTTDDIKIFEDLATKDRLAYIKETLDELKYDLEKTREKTTRERLNDQNGSYKLAHKEARKKALDWAETRPEWGLAGNAAFVIGPREMTKNTDLQGRCFLHSYDSSQDPDGKLLEEIMKGPMVVTQWINSHYYFSTVDNKVYGSGSKVTQNPKGKYGVIQGNGGDLKFGLPLESVFRDHDDPQHRPLRLTVVVYAPFEKVQKVYKRLPGSISDLVENEWIHLGVLDPEINENKKIKYVGMTGKIVDEEPPMEYHY